MDRQKIADAILFTPDWILDQAITALRERNVLSKVSNTAYQAYCSLTKTQFELMNELEIEGAENVPLEGGVVFASNHQSWLDVQVLAGASPRRIHFIAKSEFKTWPVLRHLIEVSESVFVQRGGDADGLSSIVEALRAGKAVAIYPEGTIPGEEQVSRREVDTETGLLRGKTGAVRLAINAEVPIVPVGVSGTGRALPPEIYPRLEILRMPGNQAIRVKFGEPIYLTEHYGKETTKESVRPLTDDLMRRISALIDHKSNYAPIEVPIPAPPTYEKLGVLLLHGFTSSADTVDGLIPFLEKQGIEYERPILRGHGTRYQDMRGTTARDWYVDAERALLKLCDRVDRVVVVGLSMGGLLTLELGMRHPDKIAGLVTVAAALKFKDKLAPLTKALSKVVRYWPSPASFNDPSLATRCTNYRMFPTACFASLFDYAKSIEARLPEVHVPIRVLQSKKDQIIAPEAANIIYEKVSSQLREITWFERSGHEMMQDMESAEVFREIMSFVTNFKKQ
ncbi:MAG: alpha/beta fold hydrolase [Polyangiaceae bacterium]|nr:alpha/beta fold hydrolase [Polyangiaceae bacterium]